MIIKLLDDNEKPLCVYAKGRWAGNSNVLILSEAVEILLSSFKNRPQQDLFSQFIKDWPIKAPESPQE